MDFPTFLCHRLNHGADNALAPPANNTFLQSLLDIGGARGMVVGVKGARRQGCQVVSSKYVQI